MSRCHTHTHTHTHTIPTPHSPFPTPHPHRSPLPTTQGADDRAIKKAYRKQSLIFHPDKNIGDGQAAEKFVKIAKAYEALTDEVRDGGVLLVVPSFRVATHNVAH